LDLRIFQSYGHCYMGENSVPVSIKDIVVYVVFLWHCPSPEH